MPHAAIWVDTETDPVKVCRGTIAHVLRFGWAAYQRTIPNGSWTAPEWYRFTTPRQFWRWVLSKTRKKTRLLVFAHNLAFDAPVLHTFDELPKLGFKLGHAVIESPPVILCWRRPGQTIEMLDTLNWWRTSLAKLGESIGVPKLTMPKGKAKRATWDRYCRNDVEVIRRAVHHWWTFLVRYDLGGFARTLAGQSLRAYRHRFMDAPILIDQDTRALDLARDSYHGGRTECFRLGRIKGPVHCLDVNSMYPHVMRESAFPSVLRLYVRSATLQEISRWLRSRAVCARVEIRTDTPLYAVRQGDKLIFPVGRFRCSLTTPDLKEALSRGHVAKVYDAAVYDASPLFARFVDEVYSLRLEAASRGDEVHKYLLKILMNSLYGKFAQRGTVWEGRGAPGTSLVRVWNEYDLESGTLRRFRQFAGILQERSTEPEARESHPAIASHVTAYARLFLWRLIEKAGRSEVLYCDTDSLYVTDLGLNRLKDAIDSETLGALKLEATYPWIVFHGPKDYETPDGKVIKGVRKSARWLSARTVCQDAWTSLAGILRKGSMQAPQTKQVVKTLRRVYSKGLVDRSGTVSPFRLNDP